MFHRCVLIETKIPNIYPMFPFSQISHQQLQQPLTHGAKRYDRFIFGFVRLTKGTQIPEKK